MSSQYLRCTCNVLCSPSNFLFVSQRGEFGSKSLVWLCVFCFGRCDVCAGYYTPVLIALTCAAHLLKAVSIPLGTAKAHMKTLKVRHAPHAKDGRNGVHPFSNLSQNTAANDLCVVRAFVFVRSSFCLLYTSDAADE